MLHETKCPFTMHVLYKIRSAAARLAAQRHSCQLCTADGARQQHRRCRALEALLPALCPGPAGSGS